MNDNEKVEVVEMAHAPQSMKTSQRGPGEILRDARYALELSVSEVAERLHLSRHVVTYIENDDYDKLPGETFAKGYLRGYARVVNLCGDDLIEKFDAMGFSSQHYYTAPVNLSKAPGDFDGSRLRWLTIGIVALILGLVIYWWRGHSLTLPIPSVAKERNLSVTETPVAEPVIEELASEDGATAPVTAVTITAN